MTQLIEWHQARATTLTKQAETYRAKAADRRASAWTRADHRECAEMYRLQAEMHHQTTLALVTLAQSQETNVKLLARVAELEEDLCSANKCLDSYRDLY